MHFMNPVPVMQLVEIIPGLATSKETLSTTLSLAKYEYVSGRRRRTRRRDLTETDLCLLAGPWVRPQHSQMIGLDLLRTGCFAPT